MLTLDKSEIHLWYADQAEFNGKELETLFLHWLNSGEYDRYQRYYFDRHRDRLLLSRMLIRSVLSRYSDVAPPLGGFMKTLTVNPLSILLNRIIRCILIFPIQAIE